MKKSAPQSSFISLPPQAVYRTRMAIKDNGTLMIMGPNVRKFGEDEEVDKLIRK